MVMGADQESVLTTTSSPPSWLIGCSVDLCDALSGYDALIMKRRCNENYETTQHCTMEYEYAWWESWQKILFRSVNGIRNSSRTQKAKNFGWLQKETVLLVTRKKKTRLRVSAVWNHWTGLVALLLREMYQSLKKKTQERDTSLRRFNEQEYQVIVLQQRCWWVEEGVWLTYIQDQHIVSSIVE